MLRDTNVQQLQQCPHAVGPEKLFLIHCLTVLSTSLLSRSYWNCSRLYGANISRAQYRLWDIITGAEIPDTALLELDWIDRN